MPLLVTTDLTKSDSTRKMPMGLLTNIYIWGRITDSLGCQLFERGFASNKFTCGLLHTKKSEKGKGFGKGGAT